MEEDQQGLIDGVTEWCLVEVKGRHGLAALRQRFQAMVGVGCHVPFEWSRMHGIRCV